MGYFDELNKLSGGQQRSVRWFRDKIRELGTPGQRQLIREGLIRTRPAIGQMNFFMYNPKYRNDRSVLPYYDVFPLIMPLKPTGGTIGETFMGLNFHYLSIPMRLKLLNVVTEYASKTELDENTRFNLTWNRIKRNKLVQPCIKKYIVENAKTPFRVISAEDMMAAVLLPVQKFKHATDRQVYARSRAMTKQPIKY